MSFPSSWEIQSMQRFLKAQGLAADLQRLRPDLASRVEVDDVKMYVRVRVSPFGSVTAFQYLQYPGSWLIMRPDSQAPNGWHLGTPTEVIAEAMAAEVEALDSGNQTRSPWRWNEPEGSDLVELADLLADRGHPALQVIAANRFVWTAKDGELRGTQMSEAQGSFLTVSTARDATCRIALRPTHGWFVDLLDGAGARRLDLARQLGLPPSHSPGIAKDAVSIPALAEAAVQLIESPWAGDEPVLFDSGIDPSAWLAPAATWLSRVGFDDIRLHVTEGKEQLCSEAVHVHADHSASGAGIATVERVVGVASVRKRVPVVVAAHGFTRPALRFADEAGVICLIRYDGSAHVIARGSAATAISL